MSDNVSRVAVIGNAIAATNERHFYSSFIGDNGSTFRIHDIVFLDQLGKEATKKLDAKGRLRSWWIGVIESVFIERKDKRREVFCGIRWFYRERDFDASLPSGFNSEGDELIFSDHYDENAASTIEATVSEVKLLFPGSDTGKMARDGSHFLCRWFWLTKEKVLLDLASTLTLDGPTTQRCILLLRILMRKSLGNKVPQHYRDPAGPVEVNFDTDAPAAVTSSGTMLSGGSRKLVKRGRDDESNDDNANGNDKDAGGDNDNDDDDDEDADVGKSRSKKATKPQPKRNNAKRMPTFQEASQLLLTRGELAVLSSTKSYSDVQGGLVLLKHKDASGTPLTTLLEIDKVPDVDAPYRPYLIQYVAVDGSAKSIDECVAGVELLLEEGAPSRRSLVNIRDRALEQHDYASWIAGVHAMSRYPATATEIKATIARIEALRKAHTKAKVKAAEQSNA